MACRCQERREVIKRAAQVKTTTATVEAAKFVVKTMAEDAIKAVDIRRRSANRSK